MGEVNRQVRSLQSRLPTVQPPYLVSATEEDNGAVKLKWTPLIRPTTLILMCIIVQLPGMNQIIN